jgi:hypothetical protein
MRVHVTARSFQLCAAELACDGMLSTSSSTAQQPWGVLCGLSGINYIGYIQKCTLFLQFLSLAAAVYMSCCCLCLYIRLSMGQAGGALL